jgi:hypothetical protein
MYATIFVFERFKEYLFKGGRAPYLSVDTLEKIWEIWQKGMNTGRNSEMVKAKREILECMKKYTLSLSSYSLSEASKVKAWFDNFNAFLTRNNVKISKMILTQKENQIEFDF